MKKLALLAAAFCVISMSTPVPAFASCKSDATEKKLAGAAERSFIRKCRREARKACRTDSKSLRGAARKSHYEKCKAEKYG